MSLTEAEVFDVADRLAALLVGATVRDIREVADEPTDRCIECRVPGANHYLLLSLDPDDARLSMLEARPRAPEKPTPFTMLLRARIGGAVLDEIRAELGDRIVHLVFRARREPTASIESNDAASPEDAGNGAKDTFERLTLIAEVTGRHGNLYLVDDQLRVLGVADRRKAAIRGALPHAKYQPPEPPPHRSLSRRPGWDEHDDAGSLFRWLEATTAESRNARRAREALQSARSHLKREVRRLRRKVGHIETDLDNATEADALRRRADLLQGAYGTFERGMSTVSVVDYHDPEQPLVEVETQPNIPLATQIQELYREYKRLHAAIPDIEERLLQTMQDLDAVESLRQRLDDVDDPSEITRSIADLIAQGVMRPLPSPTAAARSGEASPASRTSHRVFTSSDGWLIFVGRSARDNDVLTFHVANGRDIWMHARDWSGSHVIIRREQKKTPVPERTLREAALLAAHYSGGQNDSVVDVGYTERKHVSKPGGAAPGSVYVAAMKTLAVTPDPTIVSKLSNEPPRR